MLACLIYPEEKDKITLENLRNYVADINYLYFGVKRGSIGKIIPKQLKKPRVIFVHALYNPLFPKVIYLARDPRDVIVSYWHLKKNLEPGYKTTLKRFIRKKRVWPSSWDKHIESWLVKNKHKDLKLVKYEHLIKKPEAILKDLAYFIGLKPTKKQIKEAVALSSFQRMRLLEEKYGVRGLKHSQEWVFVRKGKIGSGKDELDKKDVLYLNSRYAKTMKKLEYA